MDGVDKSTGNEIDVKNFHDKDADAENDSLQTNAAVLKDKGQFVNDAHLHERNTSGEVNMEASISPDDVIRAGGFGAKDDINSFLPVAIDSTDFEATIRVARDYEEPQAEVSRPGLGWTAAT